MPVVVTPFGVSAGNRSLSFGQFPLKVQSHASHVDGTESLEALGARVRDDADLGLLAGFLDGVCGWIDEPELAGQILAGNALAVIDERLAASLQHLGGPVDAEHVALAVRTLMTLEHLDGVTTASALLRFLRPDRCTVLDALTAATLGYELDPDGVAHLCVDSVDIARRLTAAKIQNPRTRAAWWSAGDVGTALAALVRGW